MKKKENMRKAQSPYSPEFKEESLARCLAVGAKQASHELGIPVGTLSRWKSEMSKSNIDRSKEKDSDKPSYEELEKEIKRLKKEMGYINEINRVLKKSTAIFSSSEMGGFK